ncbi:MAG TPA: hypothetical protein VGC63_05685 [Solirubrobacterales bacterium]
MNLATPAAMFAELRVFSGRQWRTAATISGAAFLLMGIVGETLPGASLGRAVPVEWWNYVTLVLSPVLIGLIAATFVTERPPKRSQSGGAKAGAGIGAIVGTVAMACPACSPLAIPLFGAAGLLSFLAPERGLIALLSILLLAVTLALRLSKTRGCEIPH